MGFKVGILLIALLGGSIAVPTPNEVDFFTHVDTSPGRIVGGTLAPAGSVPYMAALSTGLLIRSFVCGGSIIGPKTVLTAAHCIAAVYSWGSLTSSLRVTVGTNNWNSGGQTYTVQRNVTHPNYVSSIIKNDLGMLITSNNIVLSNTVQTIPLDKSFIDAGVYSRAAGWGRISKNGALSSSLRELYLNTIEGDSCITAVAAAAASNNINAPAVQPHIELCVHHSLNHGMCNGDSGSALVRVDLQQQIGIVSWGIPCANDAPDMFVRVSAYFDWIQQNIV